MDRHWRKRRHRPWAFQDPTGWRISVRLLAGQALNPVWSPDGSLIVYAGTNVSTFAPLLALRQNGTSVKLPEITLRRLGERVRFLPDGKSLIYMQECSRHRISGNSIAT